MSAPKLRNPAQPTSTCSTLNPRFFLEFDHEAIFGHQELAAFALACSLVVLPTSHFECMMRLSLGLRSMSLSRLNRLLLILSACECFSHMSTKRMKMASSAHAMHRRSKSQLCSKKSIPIHPFAHRPAQPPRAQPLPHSPLTYVRLYPPGASEIS